MDAFTWVPEGKCPHIIFTTIMEEAWEVILNTETEILTTKTGLQNFGKNQCTLNELSNYQRSTKGLH